MASVIELKDGRNGYVDLVRHVYDDGAETSPRGMLTRELEDVTVVIHNPFDTLPLGVGRGCNPAVGAIEAMQLIGGTSTPELLVEVAPQFKAFAEDDGHFHGSYGLRTGFQVPYIVDRLKQDPDTRQAVMTFWDPEKDLEPGKRDYPCTIMHQFRIRDGKLNLSVYMRSNDVWKGVAYDYFQFTALQIAVASVLGVDVGTYAHHAGSLHVYESDFDKIDALHYSDDVPNLAPPFVGAPAESWSELRERALLTLKAVTDSAAYQRLTAAERWYADAMRRSRYRNQNKDAE